MKITQLVCSAWVCLVLSLPLTAQEPLWVHLSPSSVSPIDSGSHRGFYISRVVDARPAYMKTGFVYRGNKLIRLQLFFEEGLEENIQSFLSHSLPTQPHDQPIVVRINHLSVGEYTTERKELATATLEMDFLQEQPEGARVLCQTFTLVKKEGDSALAMHSANLQKALEDCLGQFRHYYQSQPTTSQTGELQPTSTTAYTHTPQRGIYRSFIEWKANEPSIRLPFVMKQKTHSRKNRYPHKTTIHYTDRKQGKGPVENVWGFSDGKQGYIYFQRQYWPLRPVKGGFLFDAYAVIEDHKLMVGMMESPVIGPIMGVAYVNRRQTYFLDARTGQLVEAHPAMDAVLQEPITSTATPITNLTIYYKVSGKKVASRPVQVVFSGTQDTLVAQLRPNSFVSIPWKTPHTAVVVCVQESDGACFTFVPSFSHANYLEYAPSKEKEGIVIHPVQSREAVLTLRQMGQTEVMGNKAEPVQK